MENPDISAFLSVEQGSGCISALPYKWQMRPPSLSAHILFEIQSINISGCHRNNQ
jgi:hypothetical protein